MKKEPKKIELDAESLRNDAKRADRNLMRDRDEALGIEPKTLDEAYKKGYLCGRADGWLRISEYIEMLLGD